MFDTDTHIFHDINVTHMHSVKASNKFYFVSIFIENRTSRERQGWEKLNTQLFKNN